MISSRLVGFMICDFKFLGFKEFDLFLFLRKSTAFNTVVVVLKQKVNNRISHIMSGIKY